MMQGRGLLQSCMTQCYFPPQSVAAREQVRELLKARIACASPQYIVDWLAHPQQSLENHLLHKTSQPKKLADMAMERQDLPDDDQQSVSFGAGD